MTARTKREMGFDSIAPGFIQSPTSSLEAKTFVIQFDKQEN